MIRDLLIVFCICIAYGCGRYEQLETIPVSDQDGATELTDDDSESCPGVCYTRGECEKYFGRSQD
jgi:hypothetical protein